MADIPAAARILGPAAIARAVFSGEDTAPLFATLAARLERDAADAAALYDMALLLDSRGEATTAAALRDAALAVRRDFAVVHGDGSGPRLLALVTAGGFMANTPVDFLLDGSNAVLWLCHVTDRTAALPDLPPHDAAILAVGEAPDQRDLLAGLPRLIASLPHRVVNGFPDRIASLTRDGVAARLDGIPGLICPAAVAVGRTELTDIATGRAALDTLHPALRFPLVLRPEGSHAGLGMERVMDLPQLADILAESPTQTFQLSNFTEYRGPHGLHAKLRVVMIGGKPWPVHLALSEDWIVHYLSAGMAADPARRAAEAAWFADFDTGFARRHARALAQMQQRIGLDYWGFDGAEPPDGTLLVFEVDTALIVHDMDDPATFPYKRPAMRALFRAFRRLAFDGDTAPDPGPASPSALSGRRAPMTLPLPRGA
ncbi:MAG: hypothetical protein KGN33_01735 [Paracoccaceae bacterium]|nr:hypothetical protein [Paracoccaceae bacterium]